MGSRFTCRNAGNRDVSTAKGDYVLVTDAEFEAVAGTPPAQSRLTALGARVTPSRCAAYAAW